LDSTYRLGWFSTGGDKAASDLLTVVSNSIKQREIEAEIAFVFCNRESGDFEQSNLFIELAKRYGLPMGASVPGGRLSGS